MQQNMQRGLSIIKTKLFFRYDNSASEPSLIQAFHDYVFTCLIVFQTHRSAQLFCGKIVPNCLLDVSVSFSTNG
jgi:hypothetical protein